MTSAPLLVGIGGTCSPGSSTESALIHAMEAADALGLRTKMFCGSDLMRYPHYAGRSAPEASDLIAAVREADGLIIATPGYHGSISGLVKNALDHLEDTAKDNRPYLSGMPVGIIVTAYGWQAVGSTLSTVRAIVHALRGMPTAFGAGINTSGGVFKDGRCSDDQVLGQLRMVSEQVAELLRLKELRAAAAAPSIQPAILASS